jgi:O-antigen ligase
MIISKNKVYTLLFGLFILAFMLNSVTIINLKLFYLLIPIIFTYYLGIKNIRIYPENKLSFLFLMSSILSLLFPLFEYNYILLNHTFLVIIDLLIVFLLMLIFSNVIEIKYFRIFSNISIVSTFILLIDFLILHTGSRYQAFFNDPNYLNILLLLFLFIIIFDFENTNDMLFLRKTIVFISIILLLLLSIVTASRSGILGIFVFLSFYLLHLLKKYRLELIFKKIVLLILIFILIFSFNIINIQDQVNYVISRFFAGVGNSDYGSAYMRIIEIKNGFNLIKKNPMIFLFGSGIGTTNLTEWYSNFSIDPTFHTTRIHNTIIGILVEQGIISLIIFIFFNFYLFILIWKKNNVNKFLFLGFLFGQLFISFFIWTVTFTPFWISFFILGKLSREQNFDNISR